MTTNIFDFLRTQKKITVLLIVTTLLWATGLPIWLNMVSAADVTSLSDTLSDSDSGVVSNHAIKFNMSSTGEVLATETIVIEFQSGFDFGDIDYTDLDMFVGGTEEALGATESGATWGVATSSDTITITSGTDTIAANDLVEIFIGLNATSTGDGGPGDAQITNPGLGSYTITVTAGTDSGTTRVAIIDDVSMTASVDTIFSFAIGGVATNTTAITGEGTTTVLTTATSVPFGTLDAGVPQFAAQELTVTTNAVNGFSVTVQQDGNLESSSSADIDSFVDGDATTTPTTWQSPSAVPGDEWTYGHYGITSEDSTLSGGDIFGSALYLGSFASTTPLEVFYHDGVASGATTSIGIKIEISGLQEAASDYSNTLTFIATPVF